MKEPSIRLYDWEVRGILDNRSSQLRRVAHEPIMVKLLEMVRGDIPVGPISVAKPGIYEAHLNPHGAVSVKDCNGGLLGVKPGEFEFVCPFGKPGDRLWVKETWAVSCAYNSYSPAKLTHHVGAPWYQAGGGFEFENGERGKIRPSIHMPRWASRLTLEIVKVRAERLQDISEEDARAEGVETFQMTEQDLADLAISDESPETKEFWKAMGPGRTTPIMEFRMLWSSINSKRGHGWDVNDWVWVLEFKRVN